MQQFFVEKIRKTSPLVIITFILLGLFFVRSHEAPGSSDAYWHLSVGRQVWQLKQIPSHDLFIYGSVNNKFTPVEWLSGLVMFLFVKNLGTNSIYFLRVLVGLSILFIIYNTLKLLNLKANFKLSLLLLAGFVMPARFSLDRPENFSLFFLSVVNYCCFYFLVRGKTAKVLYIIPILFLLWPNMHSYVSIGVFFIVFWSFIFIFQSIKNKMIPSNLRKFLLLSFLSIVLALVQFGGTFYFLQTPLMSSFNVTEQMSIPNRLSEIKTDYLNQVPYEIYVYFFTAMIFLLLSVTYLKKRGLNISNLFLITLFFCVNVLSFLYFRAIVVSVITTIPFVGYLIKKIEIDTKTTDALNTIFVLILSVIILISIFLGHVVGWKQYWSYTQDFNGNINGARNYHWAQQFPSKAVDEIAKDLKTSRIFTSKLWDNYFIWSLPGTQTFSDAIWEFRSKNDFYDEQKLSGGTDNWQDLLNVYKIDTVVNSQYDSIYDNLTPVFKLPNWKLVYVDSDAVVYAREDVIKNLPVDLSKIQAQKAYYPLNLSFDEKDQGEAIRQLQDLLAYDNRNAFARSQLILYDIQIKNDFDKALKLAIESKNLIPNDPIFSFYMSVIYAKQNKCQEALDFAKEMQRKSYNDANLRQSANNGLSKCAMSL